MEIEYRIGDALDHVADSERPVVVAHVVNNKAGFGAGFAGAVRQRYPAVGNLYREWAAGEFWAALPFELGYNQMVMVSAAPRLWVCNMLCQDGHGREPGRCCLDYPALGNCLTKLAAWCVEHGAEVAIPRIGSGLARGDWEYVVGIVHRALIDEGVPVFVYTLAREARA